MRQDTHLLDRRSAKTMARGLGWFSIGLGLAETVAPRTLARWLGMRGQEGLLAGFGAREIATGLGILFSENPTPWIWGRVGGDVLDLGSLVPAVAPGRRRRGAAAFALATVAGVTLLDVFCARALSAGPEERPARNYRQRSGWPRSPAEMRGAAHDFEAPRDMRIPEPLRPYPRAGSNGASV